MNKETTESDVSEEDQMGALFEPQLESNFKLAEAALGGKVSLAA